MSVPDVGPDLPPARARALLGLLGRLPQGALSRGFGRIADLPLPRPLRAPVLAAFARMLRIDVAAAEKPLAEYPSINAFFVRRLRPGLRHWPTDPALAASPVDGVVGQLGRIEGGRLIQAKGRDYPAVALLGDEAAAARYAGGAFLTLYLSPRHYHRIHAPCPGTIPEARYIPGALLPVNAPAVAHVPDLFPRNERLVCYLDGARGALGRVAVVAVGAYNVGRISAAFDPAWSAPGPAAPRGQAPAAPPAPTAPGSPRSPGSPGSPGSPAAPGWVTNRPGVPAGPRYYAPPVPVAPGDEIMAFHLGSTVVLLFEPAVVLEERLVPGQEVRVGEVIARRTEGESGRAGERE